MKSDLPNSPITEIKVFSEVDLSDIHQSLDIFIKHNYYSSDNELGFRLLRNLILSLIERQSPIGHLILIDSGVKLLDSSSDLSELMSQLISMAENVFVCSDSTRYYDISLMDNSVIKSVSSEDIFDIILRLQNLIIID